MEQKNIIIQKTARYFVLGELSEETEAVWIVCHGYAQLAKYFIRNFDVLDNKKNVIIAPEGLHRFYWEGFSGKVVASWMTKEDRAEDIKDYTNYLNAVYEEVLANYTTNNKTQINVLGFSQGAATACRWVANNKCKVDHLILWASVFPVDMDLQLNKTLFNTMRTHIVIGDNDEFINEQEIKSQEELLINNGVQYNRIRFKGKHEIHKETLIQLSEQLLKRF
jgi:predicted esterase